MERSEIQSHGISLAVAPRSNESGLSPMNMPTMSFSDIGPILRMLRFTSMLVGAPVNIYRIDYVSELCRVIPHDDSGIRNGLSTLVKVIK